MSPVTQRESADTDISEARHEQAGDTRRVKRLLLVYNARSGKSAALLDSTLKLFGAGCSLCRITHGLRTEKDAWRECRERLEVPVEGLHTDELGERERAAVSLSGLPAVLAEVATPAGEDVAESAYDLVCLADPAGLDTCMDEPEALEALLRSSAETAGLTWH